jgi:glycosyltransferase involved in cell wall biosynthesis
MIPVYNCYQTLGETLTSVLAQDRGEDQMQIEVNDEGSTDGNVKELVERIGKGRIGYFRLGLSNI